jgi:hypothetical protein
MQPINSFYQTIPTYAGTSDQSLLEMVKGGDSEAIEIYDISGNNLALEFAKKIDDISLRNEALVSVGKQLSERSNLIFKKNLHVQLQNIRSTMQQAIDKSGPLDRSNSESSTWLATQPQIQKAAVDAQLQALKETIANKDHLTVVCAGRENECVHSICKDLSETKQLTLSKAGQAASGSVDVILAPHTLYDDMEALFKASEDLLHKDNPLPIEKHPLFNYFNMLSKDGAFIATLTSGPNVSSFTDLLLDKHELETAKANRSGNIKLKIFNNVETFFRCFDIFKTYYEEKTGKTIDCELSFSMPHLPIDTFCEKYIKQYPELEKMDLEKREKFIRLLSVFSIGNDITDLNITLKMSVKEKRESQRSFMPINQEHIAVQSGSNEISLGQLNLAHQIQNLNGSELSMPYIKDADGKVQFNAFTPIMGKKHINLVDIGGGRGETNAVPNAIYESGTEICLLNIEPNEPFAKPYIEAHHALGIKNVQVLQLYAQQLSALDVTDHFKGEKADALLASHCFYFILGDMLKASLDSSLPLSQHPLWKYFDMMCDDGVLVATMQSGAGARLVRNALLGKHGLNPSNVPDETVPLLSSFGNIATFLRHFEVFAKRFQEETGKTINIKMHHSVANVPLGGFNIEQDPMTKGYLMHNPNGEDTDLSWLAPRMLDFYGNWKEQQTSATQNLVEAERDIARKTQETFLHILRAFAPGEVNMQHPNITLEITVQSKN